MKINLVEYPVINELVIIGEPSKKYKEKINSNKEEKITALNEKEYCLSPIPSLAMHCTYINSVYGIPPNFEWKKIWDENSGY